MATRTPTIARIETYGDHAHVITWSGLLVTAVQVFDVGAAVEMPGSADRSIQFEGAFGVGGAIVLEGSNDGSTWFTLTDPQGNALSKTAADLEAVAELTRYVRPRITAGEDAVTSLVATLLVKRS